MTYWPPYFEKPAPPIDEESRKYFEELKKNKKKVA